MDKESVIRKMTPPMHYPAPNELTATSDALVPNFCLTYTIQDAHMSWDWPLKLILEWPRGEQLLEIKSDLFLLVMSLPPLQQYEEFR